MNSTRTAGNSRVIVAASSMPLAPGMITSVSSRSIRSRRATTMASSALLASSTS
jgi:hypothetical protein